MRTVGVVVVGIIVGSGIALLQHRGAAPTSSPPAGAAIGPRGAATRAGPAGRAGAASMAPPRAPREIKQVDLAPTDPRYDAMALLEQENELLSPREIFEREPRDPTFAPVMEARIRASLDEAIAELGLGDRVEKVEAECHTMSCVTRVTVARADGVALYDLLGSLPLGDVQSPDVLNPDADPAHSVIVIDNLVSAATRTEAGYRQLKDRSFAAALAWAKRRQAGLP